MDSDLYRLTYVSRNAPIGLEKGIEASVAQILATFQRNNLAVGVSDALLFTDGLFAQILEGPRDAVECVFDRIQLDDRYDEVSLLSFEPVASRDFAGWAMAFVGGRDAFGTVAVDSGFDLAAADANRMAAHLAEEESFAKALAA